MLVLMQNYGIFTKIIVLQETRSKEVERARKATKKTKEGRAMVATSEQLSRQNKRKMVEELLQHSNSFRDKVEKNP